MRENLPQEAREMTRGRNEKCCGVNFLCRAVCVGPFAGGPMWLLGQALPLEGWLGTRTSTQERGAGEKGELSQGLLSAPRLIRCHRDCVRAFRGAGRERRQMMLVAPK